MKQVTVGAIKRLMKRMPIAVKKEGKRTKSKHTDIRMRSYTRIAKLTRLTGELGRAVAAHMGGSLDDIFTHVSPDVIIEDERIIKAYVEMKALIDIIR